MAGLTLNPGERDPSRIAMAVRQLMEGRSNAVGTVTLTAGPAVTTTVPAPNCGAGARVFLFPASASAAAALATTYVLPANVTAGQFVISHAAGPPNDRTFFWVALG